MAEVRVSPVAAGEPAGARVRVGDVLVVELPENATTGWVWDVDAVPEQLVALGAEDAPAAPGPAGAGAGRALRFAVRAAGAGELRLRHGRPWQPEDADVLALPVLAEPAV